MLLKGLEVRRHGALNKSRLAVAFAAALMLQIAPLPVRAEPANNSYEFVTLGTQGGPSSIPTRSQPANLIVRGDQAYLVDVGDGAIQQVIASGAAIPWLRGVFISHIHFDHIGGLFALLGLRHQMNIHSPLTIYGPSKTREVVDGLLSAMNPSARSGFGVSGANAVPPGAGLTVIEVEDGAVFKVDDFSVTAAENTHYSFTPGSAEDAEFASLSYRFDLPDRSIVYTGDTGSSDAVARLANNADLFVTEMIDLPWVVALTTKLGKKMTAEQMRQMQYHLGKHHLTTHQIGQLAKKAKVKAVVVTHLAGGGEPNAELRYVSEIQKEFDGPVVIADDLDRF